MEVGKRGRGGIGRVPREEGPIAVAGWAAFSDLFEVRPVRELARCNFRGVGGYMGLFSSGSRACFLGVSTL